MVDLNRLPEFTGSKDSGPNLKGGQNICKRLDFIDSTETFG